MSAGEGVVEAVAEHAVMDFRGTHAVAPAPAVDQVWCAVHVLHTSRDGDIDLATRDLLGGGNDGLRSRPANPVYRHGRDGHRHPAADRSLSCWIHLVAGLNDVAHHDAADLRRVKLGALQRLADDGCAEVDRGNPLE